VHAEGFRQLNEAVDKAIAAHKDPWRRLEAACAAHLTLLVDRDGMSLVAGTSLFHSAAPALQRRLNRDRIAYEERFREMIAALALPQNVDQTLLRLTLLGALNWTRIWYQSGRKSPEQIAEHLVRRILRQAL
jgi:TetR/AcrR family transcriptional regulator, cholesterol catabolism regulator